MPWRQRRRHWCHLCELPKTPWAVVWDFSEAVCRGCVNFEGADRIEPLLEAARRLRHRHGQARPRQAPPLRLEEVATTATTDPPALPAPLPPPATECLAELTTALHGHAEAWPGKPPAVRERLAALAGCAPFDVRFRKDRASAGRVLAFDTAAAQPLFTEYSRGSGSVSGGALGLAKQMFRDCPQVPGRTGCSSYKYPEAEKRRGSGEWQLLGDLFTEAARFFRPPPAATTLPQPCRHRKAAAVEEEEEEAVLSCSLCRRQLEDTHFVQCPAVPRHRFCFPCARRAIRARGGGVSGEVHCPSGGQCHLAGAGLPWAFMQGEIATILAGDIRVKRERDP